MSNSRRRRPAAHTPTSAPQEARPHPLLPAACRDLSPASPPCPPPRRSSRLSSRLSSHTHGFLLPLLLPLLLLLLSAPPTDAALASRLVIFQQPGGAFGGANFTQQPIVAALDSHGLLMTGTADCLAILVRPTGNFESLHQRYRGTAVAQVMFVNGFANFTGLYLNKIGVGYSINFQSISWAVNGFSSQFNVLLGPPAKLMVTQHPGTATGGLPFRPQPSVSLTDVGGNIITSENHATVSTRLVRSCGGNLTSTEPIRAFNRTMVQGSSTFVGLKIDLACNPYQLEFSTGANVAEKTTLSVNFTVGTGIAHITNVVQQPGGARGGELFVAQPLLAVQDAGGNVLVNDNQSVVTVSIYTNPSMANLEEGPGIVKGVCFAARTPCAYLTVPLVSGYARFTDLFIDKIGLGYTLLFTTTAGTGNEYSWTGTITHVSAAFDVLLGSPVRLTALQSPGKAHAGGLPWGLQPVIAIQDAGFNTISIDNTNTVTAQFQTNPTGFPLRGEKVVTVSLGVAYFGNLQVDKLHSGYVVRFTTTSGSFFLDVNLEVTFSSEFSAMSLDQQPGDMLGGSVAIDGDFGVFGAYVDERQERQERQERKTWRERMRARGLGTLRIGAK